MSMSLREILHKLAHGSNMGPELEPHIEALPESDHLDTAPDDEEEEDAAPVADTSASAPIEPPTSALQPPVPPVETNAVDDNGNVVATDTDPETPVEVPVVGHTVPEGTEEDAEGHEHF